MLSIVITGHGNFATGIKSMLELVVGIPENFYFVDFTQDLSSHDLFQKFSEIYQKSENEILFLADIAGGTPFNQAVMLLESFNKTGVIGGISIPLILSILELREEEGLSILELFHQAKDEAMENIKIFNNTSCTENTCEDGI